MHRDLVRDPIRSLWKTGEGFTKELRHPKNVKMPLLAFGPRHLVILCNLSPQRTCHTLPRLVAEDRALKTIEAYLDCKTDTLVNS